MLDLSHRILEVTIGQEVQRKAGLAIQTEEEQLRAQLEALNNQLRAPTQFRGIFFVFERGWYWLYPRESVFWGLD